MITIKSIVQGFFSGNKNKWAITYNCTLFIFPKFQYVSTGDKTQANLIWNSSSVDQNKNCRHHSGGPTSQSLHQFFFPVFRQIFSLLASCGSLHWYHHTTPKPVGRKHQQAAENRDKQHLLSLSWWLVLVAFKTLTNKKMAHCPLNLPSYLSLVLQTFRYELQLTAKFN